MLLLCLSISLHDLCHLYALCRKVYSCFAQTAFFFVILSLSVFTKQLLCAISLLKSFFYLLLTLLKDTFYSLLAPTPTNTFNVFALLEVCLEKTWVGYAITENLLH